MAVDLSVMIYVFERVEEKWENIKGIKQTKKYNYYL